MMPLAGQPDLPAFKLETRSGFRASCMMKIRIFTVTNIVCISLPCSGGAVKIR